MFMLMILSIFALQVHRVVTEGVMTKEVIYGPKYGQKVVCDMWKIFRQASNFTSYRYTLPTYWAKKGC